VSIDANPRAVLGDNGGPPLNEQDFKPASWELRLIEKCAEHIALMLDTGGAKRITLTRQAPPWLMARKLLFFCLQEERPFGDAAGEVRYGHLAQVEIQNALGIYRKTIGQDVQDIQRWCERSTEFEAFVDTGRDAIDAVVCLFDYSSRILELAEEQKTIDRAMQRIREAADKLETPTPHRISKR
jgi:hypothetical protein